VNYYNSLVVIITMTCNLCAPSSGDHLYTCGAISSPPYTAVFAIWNRLGYTYRLSLGFHSECNLSHNKSWPDCSPCVKNNPVLLGFIAF